MQPWSAHSKAKRLLRLPSKASQLRLAINAWGGWVALRVMRHSSKCHLHRELVVSNAYVMFSCIAGAETARQASVGPSRRVLSMWLVCTQKSCLHTNGHSSSHDILTTTQAYMGQWKVSAWQAHQTDAGRLVSCLPNGAPAVKICHFCSARWAMVMTTASTPSILIPKRVNLSKISACQGQQSTACRRLQKAGLAKMLST